MYMSGADSYRNTSSSHPPFAERFTGRKDQQNTELASTILHLAPRHPANSQIFALPPNIMKFTIATTTIAAVLAFAVGSNAISCQAQANGVRPAQCVYGNCPTGTRSVFWDTGCSSRGILWWKETQKCCI
ncbi:hypothetical protein P691DRAFT_776691 [Macrolepiota fuliginosa MF-IS2]|uniref:Uncharacterized protein n=1 Tax=Macrolepiota fuliginosa MF-IS2 TaxID=1400762 RepID=A0A9P5X8X6_9AGAR|nr:hypothetical protein P691DRAFT_776691 [Macrolepiota fuliginosa MF-IS2]